MPSACGCRDCGGASGVAFTRMVRYGSFVRAMHPHETANRVIPPDEGPSWTPCERSAFDMHWCLVHETEFADEAGWCEASSVDDRGSLAR